MTTANKVTSIDGAFGNWIEFSSPPTDQQMRDSESKITDEIVAYAKDSQLDINDYVLTTVTKEPQDSNMIYGYTVGVKAMRRVADQ